MTHMEVNGMEICRGISAWGDEPFMGCGGKRAGCFFVLVRVLLFLFFEALVLF